MSCSTHASWPSAVSDNPHGHMGTEGGEVKVKSMDLETRRQRERAIPNLTRRAALGFLVTGAGALLAACSSPAPNPPAASNSAGGASAAATGQSSPVAQTGATSAPA